MKTITVLAILGLFNVTALAESIPTTISFTNKQGVAYQNAEVTKIKTDCVIFRLKSGVGLGSVKFTELPDELQSKFGYDATRAEKEKAASAQLGRYAAVDDTIRAQQRSDKQQLAELYATRMQISGTVIQKLEVGLLISSGVEMRRYVGARGKWGGPNGEPGFEGACLLVDFQKNRVDGEPIITDAIPIGEYSYTAASGGTRTVRKFSADLAKASERLKAQGATISPVPNLQSEKFIEPTAPLPPARILYRHH